MQDLHALVLEDAGTNLKSVYEHSSASLVAAWDAIYGLREYGVVHSDLKPAHIFDKEG